MSDYESINAKVRKNIAERHEWAIRKIVSVMVKVLLAIAVLLLLEAIGFISQMFMAILTVIVICAGAFKTGYICREIKF
jgi:uncharacterized membrane protein